MHGVTSQMAERHYNVGPPYALHRRDWMRLLKVWTAFVPQVWSDYPNVDGPNKDPTRHYAEMFAYSMAGNTTTSSICNTIPLLPYIYIYAITTDVATAIVIPCSCSLATGALSLAWRDGGVHG